MKKLPISAFLVSCLLVANQAQGLEFKEGYIRAMPPGAPTTAIFGTFVNDGNQSVWITKVSLENSQKVEIHTHSMKDGVMKMRPVNGGLQLKAGEQASLKPGGLHLMVFGIKPALIQQGHSKLTVETTDGKSFTFQVSLSDSPSSDEKASSHAKTSQSHQHEHAASH